jgi:hypothetical protein
VILIDNRNGEYRMILRCDGCGREIRDATMANGVFPPPRDAQGRFQLGEHPLLGIYCKESCVHMVLGEHLTDDTWELHQVIEMLKRTMSFKASRARQEVATMARLGL